MNFKSNIVLLCDLSKLENILVLITGIYLSFFYKSLLYNFDLSISNNAICPLFIPATNIFGF